MNLGAKLRELAERAKTDDGLRHELQNDPDGVLAREMGIPAEQWREYAAPMSDNELAAVAAGIDYFDSSTWTYECGDCGARFPAQAWLNLHRGLDMCSKSRHNSGLPSSGGGKFN